MYHASPNRPVSFKPGSACKFTGGEPVSPIVLPSPVRINVIIVIVGTRALVNFTPYPIFYGIPYGVPRFKFSARIKVAEGSRWIVYVQVGVYGVCIAGCSVLDWPRRRVLWHLNGRVFYPFARFYTGVNNDWRVQRKAIPKDSELARDINGWESKSKSENYWEKKFLSNAFCFADLSFKFRFLSWHSLHFYHWSVAIVCLTRITRIQWIQCIAPLPRWYTVSNARRLKSSAFPRRSPPRMFSYIISDTNEDIGCRLADR